MRNKEEPGIQHLTCKHTSLTEIIQSDFVSESNSCFKTPNLTQPDLNCARSTISISDNSINTFE